LGAQCADAWIMPRAPQYLPHLLLLLLYAIILEYTVRSRDWFFHYPYIDNLMHFGWGAAIALGIIVFWRNNVMFVLIAVFLWQVLWEIGEMAMDRINNDPPHMRDIPFPDGAIDTVLDLAGAAFVLLLTRRSRQSQDALAPDAANPGPV
jgi:hypothetical protein